MMYLNETKVVNYTNDNVELPSSIKKEMEKAYKYICKQIDEIQKSEKYNEFMDSMLEEKYIGPSKRNKKLYSDSDFQINKSKKDKNGNPMVSQAIVNVIGDWVDQDMYYYKMGNEYFCNYLDKLASEISNSKFMRSLPHYKRHVVGDDYFGWHFIFEIEDSMNESTYIREYVDTLIKANRYTILSETVVIDGEKVDSEISDKLFETRENRWKKKLPKSFKQFMKSNNGVIPSSKIKINNNSVIDEFLCIVPSVKDTNGHNDIDVILSKYDEFMVFSEDSVGYDIIPFAKLNREKLLCLCYKGGKEPSVCVWSYEGSSKFNPNYEMVYNSFSAFVNSIK